MAFDVTFSLKATDRTGKALKSAGKNVDSFGDKWKKFGKVAAVGVAAAGVALGAFAAKAVKDLVKTGDQLDKMSGRTGIAVEELSAMGFALEQTGSSLETFEKANRNLAINVSDAALGIESAADKFHDFGLPIDELIGLNPTEQFHLLADAIAEIHDPTERAAAAASVFGTKAGPELLNLLQNGSAGITQLTDEAGRLGRVISTQTASDAAALGDSINRLKSIFTGAATGIAAGLLPAVLQITEALVSKFQPILDELIPVVSDLLTSLAPLTPLLVEGIAVVLDTLVVPALTALADFLSTDFGRATALAVAGITAVTVAVSSNPFGLLAVAAIAATTAIIKHWTPIKNFFSDLWNGILKIFKSAINGYIGYIQTFVDVFRIGINAIINAWNSLELSIPGFSIDPLGRFGPTINFSGFTLGVPDIPTIPQITLPTLSGGYKVPRLGEGGFVAKPTLAVVGDAPGGEYVVPARQMHMQQPINLNVQLELEGQLLAEYVLQNVNEGLRTGATQAVRLAP